MRRTCALGLVAVVAAVAAHGASSAPGLRLIETGSPKFPHRSYVLAMPERQSISAADVSVTENGGPVGDVTVTPAGVVGHGSFGTVLLIDSSKSMRGEPIADAMVAARAFAARRNPGQQLALITFDKTVRTVLPFSTDGAEIARALAHKPRLAEGTHIYDAVRAAVQLVGLGGVSAPSIVLLSDGADVGSSTTIGSATSSLHAAHIRLFSVGLKSRAFDPSSLRELARASGGSSSVAASPSALPGIYDTLGFRLANEYLVRYDSLVPAGHRVVVRVAVAGGGAASAGYRVPPVAVPPPPPPAKSSTVDRAIKSWILMILVVLVFLYLLLFGLRHAFARPVRSVPQRLSEFVSVTPEDERRRREAVRTALQEGQGALLARFAIWKAFVEETELAGIGVRPNRLALWAVAAGLVLAFVAAPLIGIAAIVFVVIPPVLLRLYVRGVLARRRATFADQLADNLEVLASALRAGHSLVGALAVVVDDADEPSRSELRRVLADEQLGVPLEDALRVTVKRMANRDLDQVAVVAVLQRDAGANSAEVLGQIVDNIRARQEIRRLITVLTAQGRMARWIVSALPVALLLVISAMDPGYMRPMWHETIGHVFLGFAAVLIAAGSVFIGRIVDIEV